jgi:hypothetical protein
MSTPFLHQAGGVADLGDVAAAGLDGEVVRSVRRKTIPVPAWAGTMRSVTGAPLCRPTPVHSAAARIVCSKATL